MINKVLILTVGLPRSGKSTWAQKQGNPIVCPDAIRMGLYGRPWEDLAEDHVWSTAALMVRSLFIAGNDTVILDATNVTKERRDKWRWNPKWEGKVPQWIRKYQVFDTPKEVCIARAHITKQEYLHPIIERMDNTWEDVSTEEQDELPRE